MNAKVWLVGAGPGDPELLTLKAVRALQQAAVAMIENASMPQQRECRSDVRGMVEDARGFGLRSPAILVIGEVVGEQQALELVSIAG